VIDLTVDDPPSDKGKQKAGIETIDALDRPGTSAVLGDDLAEASGRWPNYAGLALVRVKEELPRWGRSTLEFRDASNPSAEPFFALTTRTRCNTRSSSRDSVSTPYNPCAWSQIPWCGVCRRLSR
jgi:hypothetical protein